MKASVTIDNLGIKDHMRWAQDQQILESAYSTEASVVAPHPEVLGMSMIYTSKFDELFDLQKRNQHFASFSPPEDFHLFRKRFFSYRLFPSIDWEDKEENMGDSDENQDPDLDLIHAITRIKAAGNQASSLFEKDKCAMLGMLESINWINKLIKHINARKLQYQKG